MTFLKTLARRVAAGFDLRYLLPASVVLLLIGLWAGVFHYVDVERDLAVKAAWSASESLLATFQERTVRVLRQIDQASQFLKFAFEENHGNLDRVEIAKRKGLLPSDVTLTVAIADAEGNVAPASVPFAPTNVADREFFQWHAQHDADLLLISEPFLSRSSQRWTISLTRRLNRPDGTFAGVVIFGIEPAYLTTPYEQAGVGTRGAMNVIGEDGVVRARRVGDQVSFGMRVDFRQFLGVADAGRAAGSAAVSPVDGVRRYPAYRMLKEYPLLLSAAIAEDDALELFRRRRSSYFWSASAVSLLMVALGALLTFQGYRLSRSRREAHDTQDVYRATAEGSLDALLILQCERDRHGRITDFVFHDVNTRGASLIGLLKEQIVGQRLSALFPGNGARSFFDKYVRAAETGALLEEELQLSVPRIHVEWLHHQVIPLRDGVAVMTRDITVRKRAEREKEEKRSLLQTLVDNIPIAVYAKSSREEDFGRFLFWNKAAEVTFGLREDEAIGKTVHDLVPKATADEFVAQDRSIVANPMVQHYPADIFESPWGRRYIHTIKAPIFDSQDRVQHILCISQDVTQAKVTADRLRLTSKVIDEAGEGVVVTDAEERIVLINPAFASLTGFDSAELLERQATATELVDLDSKPLAAMRHQVLTQGAWAGETTHRRKDGSKFPCWLNITSVEDDAGQLVNFVVIVSDITILKESQHRLEQLANFDTLTGLPNRRLFHDRLKHALERAARGQRKLGLLFVDLDDFKTVNDTLGHDAGDLLLQEVAARLKECVRGQDTVCRLGGDEFTVIMEDLNLAEDAALVAQRIVDALAEPFSLTGQTAVATASVGIGLFPDDGRDASTLLRHTDLAMYRAKELGKSGYHLFSHTLSGRTSDRLRLERELRNAIEEHQLFLVYQPKVNLRTGRTVGFEALVRWNHPERGTVSPAEFIPLAETTGLVVPLGEWVLRRVCSDLRAWSHAGIEDFSVSVNVSPRQFMRGDVVEVVARALREHDIEPRRLELELTESAMLGDLEVAEATVMQLKALGISISLDDFGTGYSSLTLLKRLAVDSLKIDRSFTRDVPGDAATVAIVSAILMMARALKMPVVAEGVETTAQLQMLKQHGCDLAQGYLFSRPVLPADVPALLQEKRLLPVRPIVVGQDVNPLPSLTPLRLET